jgi:hypothetical protein
MKRTKEEILKIYNDTVIFNKNNKTNDMRKKILTLSEDEMDQFILARLKYVGTFDEDGRTNHLRFDMSGISDPNFKWIKENKDIWDLFIDCGLYDRVCLFYMDTYKGNVHLFYKWFEDDDYLFRDCDATMGVLDFTNMGTRDMIKRALKFFCIENQDKKVRRLN